MRRPGPTMLVVLDAVERLAGADGVTVMKLARDTGIADHQVRSICDKLEVRGLVRIERSPYRLGARPSTFVYALDGATG